jgi:triosephosphate isomerase
MKGGQLWSPFLFYEQTKESAMTRTRTMIIAGNWKMNYGPQEAADFVKDLLPGIKALIEDDDPLLCILCPPAISLGEVARIMSEQPVTHVELGAQNMYFEEQGAYTGEISPGMVKELCSTVILGHSERREYFGESDELVNKKLLAACKHGLRPIVCVGENEQQHKSEQTTQVIEQQIERSLANLEEAQASEVVIAYEPIWAIGTGMAATVEGAGGVIHIIRQKYGQLYGQDAASAVRILYGGSVTADNISEFLGHPDIDGALVGGASIKAQFADIVHKAKEAL